MVVNGIKLLQSEPIKNMLRTKVQEHGISHGLAEVGYDIRIKQEVRFAGYAFGHDRIEVREGGGLNIKRGRFTIASAMEEFDMPNDLMGIVHDKSTWARRGLSVFNTVIEPGWKGFLTLELVYHGSSDLIIPAGSGIAQVVFHKTVCHGAYTGKYQNQEDRPVEAISS